MEQDQMRTAITQLLLSFGEEADEDYPCPGQVQAPPCNLDLETYGLLLEQTGGSGYTKLFTNAVRRMKSIVTPEQLNRVIAIVKVKRSGANHKTIRPKLVKSEWEWIEQTANTMRIKPSRILEAVVFVFLRTDQQISINQ